MAGSAESDVSVCDLSTWGMGRREGRARWFLPNRAEDAVPPPASSPTAPMLSPPWPPESFPDAPS